VEVFKVGLVFGFELVLGIGLGFRVGLKLMIGLGLGFKVQVMI
jgi:hypothetical protein